MLAGEEWKECVVMRAGGHNGVILDSSVGVLVELQHWDTLARFFSPLCAEEFVCFPYKWHQALQKGLGLSSVTALCSLSRE